MTTEPKTLSSIDLKNIKEIKEIETEIETKLFSSEQYSKRLDIKRPRPIHPATHVSLHQRFQYLHEIHKKTEDKYISPNKFLSFEKPEEIDISSNIIQETFTPSQKKKSRKQSKNQLNTLVKLFQKHK
jgi:hypothetical protein